MSAGKHDTSVFGTLLPRHDLRDPFVDETKTGIFRDHRCARCNDGARPERCPTPDRPGNCGEPQARND